jgi:hypothetical protein
MDKNLFLNIFKDTIRAITDKRYFSTERGYQGQLLAELNRRMESIKLIFQRESILEQEYQKTLDKHEITIRPDIIIHIPYEREGSKNRSSNNFVVIQIKLNASERRAKEDFRKLNLMFEKLSYPLGIFLNINSNETFYNSYSGDYKARLYCFAARLVNKEVVLHESP